MKDRGLYKIILLLSVIGIGLASYLYYNYLNKPAVEFCTINDRINCDAVTKGPISMLFGIPVSFIGLTGYVVILLSVLFKFKKVILGAAIFGMVFCLRLTYLELFKLNVICPVCLLCQLDMLSIFILAIFLNRKREIQ